ncbi:hybrid sensor histidine kinase/response regulator [Parerythrobacter lacustris]|uniref:histidine kinase n=1 Tax=Parerythrobacter lacustris TaxID=2969984 RepID=A0ABT1XSE9_9SPHN|nr:response regulator [Parerythrobacter lacustris]MCR2834537.1 response regulator [Parerythrobacter lacustris]
MNVLGEAQGERQTGLIGGIAAAAVASAALLWWISGTPVLAFAYFAALVVLILAASAASRMRGGSTGDELAPPDWSVTVTAIEQPGLAVAITDRANRLACANSAYAEWFGAAAAPPNLPLDRPSLERLTRAAREAWRDGTARADDLLRSDGTPGWHASAERAGRGEDYLIWRISEAAAANHADAVGALVGGALGRMLSVAGIETALVGPDGIVRAVGRGFAQRASGDPTATLAGQEFVSFLRSDDRDRIFFAREGRKGAPLTLVQVPLEEPSGVATSTGSEVPSLMLLLEGGAGIGSGSDGPGAAATPQLEALLGALPLGLAMTDRDGRFLFGNEAFKRAVGREGQAMPSYPSDLVTREDKGALADAVRRFGKGPALSGDMAIRLRDTPDDPVSLGLAGVRGLGDAAVLLSLSDSTEETRLKRQVAQATKMQAVGQLAGGVAHDFNNVLTAIIGYCDLMLLRHTPGDSDYDDIQQIRANSNRAASLTRQLLAFSRQQTLQPKVVQLPDVVSEVSQLLKRLLGENIELKVRHDRDLGPVRADPQQLEQVIVNLAVNARDAIQSRGDGRGKLTLATRRISARDVRAMGSEIIPAGEYTAIVAQDTGGGIAPEKLGKIFEPFFTTKVLGKGTGLGLSTVYGIVKQSGGYIFADNVEGISGTIEGARFTIYLPVYSGPVSEEHLPASARDAEPEASTWLGSARILLVEDEDMVRAVAERALARSGHKITLARDGEEGLAAVANGGEFDLIVSDVVMPGMSGPRMVKAIRKVRPDLPVLFMSGYAEEQLRKEIDVENMHFLAKPFSVQQIGDRVAAILNAGQRSAKLK